METETVLYKFKQGGSCDRNRNIFACCDCCDNACDLCDWSIVGEIEKNYNGTMPYATDRVQLQCPRGRVGLVQESNALLGHEQEMLEEMVVSWEDFALRNGWLPVSTEMGYFGWPESLQKIVDGYECNEKDKEDAIEKIIESEKNKSRNE